MELGIIESLLVGRKLPAFDVLGIKRSIMGNRIKSKNKNKKAVLENFRNKARAA